MKRNVVAFNLALIALAVGVTVGIQFLGGSPSLVVPEVMAQTASPEPTPSPAPTGCSPGFYKNHPEIWVGICCGDTTQRTCEDLMQALTCKGSDASCGRSAAARYLDACTGCSE